MSTYELLDELEAGELSVAFEGEEPETVLEWAIERFSPRIGVSTAFQIDGVAIIDMAYRIDPEIHIFSVDTGRLPAETHTVIAQLRERYPGLNHEVWDYVRENDVPYHPLYDQSYTSIGCAPCTRAIRPGEADRAGRWWWESNAPKECGIHCSIETGGFEHELHAILGEDADD